MPYVEQEVRDSLDHEIEHLSNLINAYTSRGSSGGALNYTIARLAAAQVIAEGADYRARAETLGHLTAAVGEFQRRVLDDYETIKLIRNEIKTGDPNDVPEYAKLSGG